MVRESVSIAQFANSIAPFFVETSTSDKLAKAETERENSARQAFCEWTYVSTGVGQQRIAKPILFGICFRTEPHLTTGSATIKNPDPLNWHDPIGLAGVRSWQRDSRGLYVGAYIWIRTDMYAISGTTALPPAKTSTMHYLTFSGNAIKEITPPVSQTLPTRPVGVA